MFKRTILLLVGLILASLFGACGDEPTVGPTQTSAGSISNDKTSLSQMLNYISQNAPRSARIYYENYAQALKAYGLTSEAASKLSPEELAKGPFYQLGACASSLLRFSDLKNAPQYGWTPGQVEASISTWPGEELCVNYGQFDPAAIEKSLTALNYTKQTVGQGLLFSLPSFAGTDRSNIGLVGTNFVLTNRQNTYIQDNLKLLGGDKSLASVGQDTDYTMIAQALGEVQMVVIQQAGGVIRPQNPYAKLPLPKLQAVAYREPQKGDITFLTANLYDSPAKANEALTAFQAAFANDSSSRLKQPYNTIFKLDSTGVQGQLVTIKLKPLKSQVRILDFFSAEDLPTLLGERKD